MKSYRRKTNYLIYVTFAITVVIALIYFTRNWIAWQNEKQAFKDLKINSRIIKLRDLSRGNYEIQLNVHEKIMSFDLPIAYEVKNDSIAVGDSLSKNAMNGKFEIFRIGSEKTVIKISEATIY